MSHPTSTTDQSPEVASHQSLFQRIWYPFIILFVITACEFIIAFTVHSKVVKVPVFVAMTILKAFYIVAYFMHLKYERLNLIYTILVPTLFIVGLVVALLYEASRI